METKEFISKTVGELANYSLEEQVNIFNEIKQSLLHIRKQAYESNECAIKNLVEINQILQHGNAAIVGDNLSAIVKPN